MTTYKIDTAKEIRNLTDNGVAEQSATAIVDLVSKAHEELATKQDLELVETRLGGKIEKLDVSMNAKMEGMEARLRKFAWGASIAVIVSLVAALSGLQWLLGQ